MIKDVTDLEVYRLSLEYLDKAYEIAGLLAPEHRKLKYQLTESSEKIAPQIAEGFAKKRSTKEFCRFLSMAVGSSDETITHLRVVQIVAKRFTRISVEECDQLIEKYKILSKKLNKLLSSWQRFN
jgi:four helix bundle protein